MSVNLREELSIKLTQRINEVLLSAYGNEWQNPRFVVMYQPGVEFTEPNVDANDEWHAEFEIQGQLSVRLFSDAEQLIDPISLVRELRLKPISIQPDSSLYAPEQCALMFSWKPDMAKDRVYDDGQMFVELTGALRHCFLLCRTDFTDFVLPEQVVNQVEL